MPKRDRYREYLQSIVGHVREYSLLLDQLYNMEFYSLIPNDDNRGEDGKDLRRRYIDEIEALTRPLFLPPEGPCTVLEMLIGLSYRLEFETLQSQWEKSPHEWFWILIENLGLSWATNTKYCHDDGQREVDETVRIFLDRAYDYRGHGGLFPLKRAKKDQRRVEIWYQMSAYVLENYPI